MTELEHKDRRRLTILRTACLCVLAFLLMGSYSIVRPATESLFLKAHKEQGLPWVWLLVAIGMVLVVAIYNRHLPRSGLIRLYGAAAVVSALLLVLLLWARARDLPTVHYWLYAWKDIYMVVMVEIYYSYANTIFPIQTARWVYSLFGLSSALGGVAGSAAATWLASHQGTVETLWTAPPVLLLIGILCLPFSRLLGDQSPQAQAPELQQHRRASLVEAARVVRRSSYLLMVLALIALVQTVITLVDFEFNKVALQTYPVTDARTASTAAVYGVVSLVTVLLHVSTGPILRLAGAPLTLLAIPCLLGAGLSTFAVARSFTTASLVKVASKCFDYTLFRVAKELLYIPLSYEEKTLGKSLVDMVTYRVAKGFASLLLLALVALHLSGLVTPMGLLMVVVWLVVTVVVVRRFRAKVTRQQELSRG